jgi:PAS domain S-box-containing protein
MKGTRVQSILHKAERSQWWLSWSSILVTLLLTGGIASFAFPVLLHHEQSGESAQLTQAARGLVGLVLLFDVYAIYQQMQIHRIRRELISREELFRLISENAADMIAVIDSKGNRLFNSPSYERILGYSSEELYKTPANEQIHPDDLGKVLEATKDAYASGVGRRVEYRMKHKDGRWILLESTASAIRNARGEIEKLVVVNRDVSETRRLEEQLRQSQKLDAIGRLSGGVAHDFNNLLGVIIGYTEVLQEQIEETSPLRQCVDEVLKAGRRAATLTRQLLAFSRQQVLEAKVLLLNTVVSEMGNMLRRMIGEDMELITRLDENAGRIRADQGQIEQVIMNLAVNARDAMPDGGKLEIATSNFEVTEAFARRFAYPVLPGAYVLLTVSDSGTGMDAATQQRIFEPFFTTKEKGKGTGLGLSTVYGVVKQSGGYIDVESTPGKGSTFKIYLPRVAEIADAEEAPAVPLPGTVGAETVLLVEDEASLRTLTKHLLAKMGYTVLEACDGKDALEVSRRFAGKIDLLLTDMVMPGIGGRALASLLIEERPTIRVVYMSGYAGQTYSQTVLEPGAFFLQKPFDREKLGQKVLEALQSSGAAATSKV